MSKVNQQLALPRFARWLRQQFDASKTEDLLAPYPNIRRVWPSRYRKQAYDRPPIYAHYIDIISSIYSPSSREVVLSSLENTISACQNLDGWDFERRQRYGRSSYAHIQALMWELWVGSQLTSAANKDCKVTWQKAGADFSLIDEHAEWQIECVVPTSFWMLEAFIEDILSFISACYLPSEWSLKISRQYGFHTSVLDSAPQHQRILELLIDPVIELAETGKLAQLSSGKWPKRLSQANVTDDLSITDQIMPREDGDFRGLFCVILEGDNTEDYIPTEIDIGGHGDGYALLVGHLQKQIEQKLSQFEKRPGKNNILAVNLTGLDTQIANWHDVTFDLMRRTDPRNVLYGVFGASVGIDGRVTQCAAWADTFIRRQHILRMFAVATA